MTIIHLLVVVAIVQSIFLAGIVALLTLNRGRSAHRRRVRERLSARVGAPLQQWLVGGAPATAVAEVLATLSPDQALEQAIIISTSRAGPTQRDEFCSAIRDEPWVKRVLERAASRNWWRRLDAARLLAVVGSPRDRDLLLKLLDDPHPAVQGVAAASLPAVGDLDAVAHVLERLPERSLVVRLYQFSMLKDTWWLTTAALMERITIDTPAQLLEVWIPLAEAIATAELLERVLLLRGHSAPLVRVAVARAMKRYYHPAAQEALVDMLHDDDWRVRALAARSLGTLGDERSVDALASGLRDRQWWVRFRSALALAQLGERGRGKLRETRQGADVYAAEMASLISGLSPGSIVELSEV